MKKLIIPLLLSISTLSYAQYPSDFSIEKLENSYIQSKKCEYTCGVYTGLKIKSLDLSSQQIIFEIPVSASRLTTVALPFDINSFHWTGFFINGKKTQAATAEHNRIVVAIPEGTHTLEVTAKIKSDQLKIPLLDEPKYFENQSLLKADIKQINGNYFLEIENGYNLINEKNKNKDEIEISQEIFGTTLYSINREIFLSDKWKVKTKLVPLLPIKYNNVTKISLTLLPGEKPLNDQLEIIKNKINVSISNEEIAWESSLVPTEKLILKNTDEKNLETWTIYNENDWLYSYKGMNPTSSSTDHEYKTITSWVMWPREQVELSLSLPRVASGQISNVENFNLKTNWDVTPLKHEASFTINTSIGGRYTIKFDDKNTESIEVKVNKKLIETKIKDGVLALDLSPGSNTIFILFKSGEDSFFYKTPNIKFESNVTNAIFTYELDKRWLLFSGGGDVRPAVLLWGVMFSFSLFAYALSKLVKTPLGFTSWFLLFLGLFQTSIIGSVIIVGWILAFGFRNRLINSIKENDQLDANNFNKIQIGFGIISTIGLLTLLSTVANGLLYHPDVFVSGYRSYTNNLWWYIQTWNGVDKNPWILSLPISVYRVLMLGWAIWLAINLMGWLKWMWQEYSIGGYWKNAINKEDVENSVGKPEEKLDETDSEIK